MSGDSTSDATALNAANVGLSMGSGQTLAKDHADLVILDNDFKSIHNAIMWGRTIFDNVRKFMQFQLTININLCFIVFLSGLTLGHSPFNVIQLLWINLIMDTLGAIAICTEPYQAKRRSEGHSSRISRKDKILTVNMWRNIVVQFVYQMIAILILMYFGQMMFFDKPFNLIMEKLRHEEANPELGINVDDPTDKLKLHTMIFHTFVLMNLFNQINCRIVNEGQLNIFRTLFNNYLFWLVLLFEMALQNYMIYLAPNYKLGSALLQVAPITKTMSIVAWSLGVGTIPVALIGKFIPIRFFFWTEKINLEEDVDDNKLLQYKTMMNERMNTINKEKDKYMRALNDSNVDDPDGYDKEMGQINGQDDDDDDDEEDDPMNYSQNNGYRSSNVQRYSMAMQMKNKVH